jgi:hypothetical protein
MIWRAESPSITPGGDSRFYGELSLPKIGLLRALHKCAGCNRTRKAAQEMVASKESGIDCNAQPTLEGFRAGDPGRIVRDVSTSLDMTKDGILRD